MSSMFLATHELRKVQCSSANLAVVG